LAYTLIDCNLFIISFNFLSIQFFIIEAKQKLIVNNLLFGELINNVIDKYSCLTSNSDSHLNTIAIKIIVSLIKDNFQSNYSVIIDIIIVVQRFLIMNFNSSSDVVLAWDIFLKKASKNYCACRNCRLGFEI